MPGQHQISDRGKNRREKDSLRGTPSRRNALHVVGPASMLLRRICAVACVTVWLPACTAFSAKDKVPGMPPGPPGPPAASTAAQSSNPPVSLLGSDPAEGDGSRPYCSTQCATKLEGLTNTQWISGNCNDTREAVWNSRVQFLLNSYHHGMPHSFSVPANYYRSKQYLAKGNHKDPLDCEESIEDRVSTQYGLNLYDGATWEVGLGLENHFNVVNTYHRQVLYPSSTGRASPLPGGLKNIRANSEDYKYGESQTLGSDLTKITLPQNATNPDSDSNTDHQMEGGFLFRMISDRYLCEDPLIGSYSTSFQYMKPPETEGQSASSKGPSWNLDGAIIWNDWKPITGEQAWGVMIGPLQHLYMEWNGTVPCVALSSAMFIRAVLCFQAVWQVVAFVPPREVPLEFSRNDSTIASSEGTHARTHARYTHTHTRTHTHAHTHSSSVRTWPKSFAIR